MFILELNIKQALLCFQKEIMHSNFVNGNLAVSNIRKLECSSFDFHSIAYGYGKFKEKIHFTEYYP